VKIRSTPAWQLQQPQLRMAQADRGFAKPRVVLTTAMPSPAPANTRHPGNSDLQPAYATTIEFSPAYAAIPFADGWLIIQL
jgi:hypothetical protein